MVFDDPAWNALTAAPPPQRAPPIKKPGSSERH